MSIRELSKGLNSIILIDKIRTFLLNVARYSTTQLCWHGSNGIISLFFPGIDELSIEVFHIADSEEPGCARSPLEIYRIATLTTSHWEAYTTVLGPFGGICPNSVQNILGSSKEGPSH